MTTDPIRPDGLKGVDPTRGGAESAAGARPRGGADFEALLEKLETRAEGVRAASGAVDSPENLSGAVENARTALSDALSLGDQLLEAYRQAAQQRQGGDDA
jgi:hypothetical protein